MMYSGSGSYTSEPYCKDTQDALYPTSEMKAKPLKFEDPIVAATKFLPQA